MPNSFYSDARGMPGHFTDGHSSSRTAPISEDWQEGRGRQSNADEKLPSYNESRRRRRSSSTTSRCSYLYSDTYGYSQAQFEKRAPSDSYASSVPETAETWRVSPEEQAIQTPRPHPDSLTILPASADEETRGVSDNFQSIPLGGPTPTHAVQSSGGPSFQGQPLRRQVTVSSVRPAPSAALEDSSQSLVRAVDIFATVLLLPLLPLFAYSISFLGELLSRTTAEPQPRSSPWSYATPSLLWSSVCGVFFTAFVGWRVFNLTSFAKDSMWAPFSILTKGDRVSRCLLVGGLVVGIGALPAGLATLGSPAGVRALDGLVVNTTGLGVHTMLAVIGWSVYHLARGPGSRSKPSL